MKNLFLLIIFVYLSACSAGPVGNKNVPEPKKAVEINRYLGKWYEIARYENRFEKGCEAVTAEYAELEDGLIEVINTCRKGGADGEIEQARGKAKLVDDSQGAKLKVSFFGPFYFGDYWVLDHAEDYSWSIVGEPSGRYLWLLARSSKLTTAEKTALRNKAQSLGYDMLLLRETMH